MGILDFFFSKKQDNSPAKQKHAPVNATDSNNTKGNSRSNPTAEPPREWQLKQAAKLGIQVVEGMTYAEIQDAIDKAEFNKPPTHQQLKKAKLFGVHVPPDSKLTYGQLALLLDQAALNQPANPEQVTICEKVGIKIPSNMTVEIADKLITEAKANPKFKGKFEEIEKERLMQSQAEEDLELREQYGESFVKEYRRWEKISDAPGAQYLLIYRKEKKIAVDVVEFDGGVEIIEGKSPSIKLTLLLPTKESFEKNCYSLVWEKEEEVRSSRVLHIQKLDRALLDCEVMFGEESKDLVEYKKVIEKAKAYAKKFESS